MATRCVTSLFATSFSCKAKRNKAKHPPQVRSAAVRGRAKTAAASRHPPDQTVHVQQRSDWTTSGHAPARCRQTPAQGRSCTAVERWPAPPWARWLRRTASGGAAPATRQGGARWHTHHLQWQTNTTAAIPVTAQAAASCVCRASRKVSHKGAALTGACKASPPTVSTPWCGSSGLCMLPPDRNKKSACKSLSAAHLA